MNWTTERLVRGASEGRMRLVCATSHGRQAWQCWLRCAQMTLCGMSYTALRDVQAAG